MGETLQRTPTPLHLNSIARNRQRLIELGVLDAVADLQAVAPAAKPTPKKAKSYPAEPSPSKPTRRSRRLQEAEEGPLPSEATPEPASKPKPAPKHPRTPPAHTLEEKLAQLELGGLVEYCDKFAKCGTSVSTFGVHSRCPHLVSTVGVHIWCPHSVSTISVHMDSQVYGRWVPGQALHSHPAG